MEKKGVFEKVHLSHGQMQQSHVEVRGTNRKPTARTGKSATTESRPPLPGRLQEAYGTTDNKGRTPLLRTLKVPGWWCRGVLTVSIEENNLHINSCLKGLFSGKATSKPKPF